MVRNPVGEQHWQLNTVLCIGMFVLRGAALRISDSPSQVVLCKTLFSVFHFYIFVSNQLLYPFRFCILPASLTKWITRRLLTTQQLWPFFLDLVDGKTQSSARLLPKSS